MLRITRVMVKESISVGIRMWMIIQCSVDCLIWEDWEMKNCKVKEIRVESMMNKTGRLHLLTKINFKKHFKAWVFSKIQSQVKTLY
jgi:hypothetical protein